MKWHPTYAEVQRLLRYNKRTGVFTWRARGVARFNSRLVGSEAGTIWHGPYNRTPYRIITISRDGRCCRFRAHRLAWLYVTGEWPSHDVDHINHDGLDNRWINLRLAVGSINRLNREAAKGVQERRGKKRHRFYAKIQNNRKTLHLGTFLTEREAHAAYKAERKKLIQQQEMQHGR